MTTLAELRQASLKEQKQKEQIQHSHGAAPIPASASELARQPEPAASISAASSTSAMQPSLTANGHLASSLPTLPPSAQEATFAASASSDLTANPESDHAERFFTRIHDSVARKTIHPAGAKVSADMPPALFHRAKRYCLDHGNITMRQVLIDLLTNYLEEEGY